VDARIAVLSGNEATEANELLHWLKNDRKLRNPVKFATGDAEPKELSAAVEIIVAAIGTGGIAQFISSLRSWLSTRTPELTIEVRTKKGRRKLTARNFGSGEIAELTQILRDDDDA
jgi:Effector Associated Constant Component 1